MRQYSLLVVAMGLLLVGCGAKTPPTTALQTSTLVPPVVTLVTPADTSAPAEIFTEAIRDALDRGEIAQARQQSREALRQYPADTTLSRLSCETSWAAGDQEGLQDCLAGAANLLSPAEYRLRMLQLQVLQKDLESAYITLQATADRTLEEELLSITLLMLRNEHAAVQEEITALLEHAPTTPQTERLMTNLQEVYRDFDIVSDGKYPHVLTRMAQTFLLHGQTYLGYLLSDTALRDWADYRDAWLLRGYANLQMGRLSYAEEDLSEAYRQNPDDPETCYFLGQVREKQGETGTALQLYEKALQLGVADSNAVRWQLLELYAAAGRAERVVELSSALLAPDVRPEQFRPAVVAAIETLEDSQAALNITQQLLAYHPDDVTVLNLHAWALITAGDAVAARTALKHAEQLDPENPETMYHVAMMMESQGNVAPAKMLYERAYSAAKKLHLQRVMDRAGAKLR